LALLADALKKQIEGMKIFKLCKPEEVRIILGILGAGTGSRIQRQRSGHTYEVHGAEV
jgi:hypothetical protein